MLSTMHKMVLHAEHFKEHPKLTMRYVWGTQVSVPSSRSVAQPPSHPVLSAADVNAAVTNCSAYAVYSLAGSQ